MIDQPERFADAIMSVPLDIKEWKRQRSIYQGGSSSTGESFGLVNHRSPEGSNGRVKVVEVHLRDDTLTQQTQGRTRTSCERLVVETSLKSVQLNRLSEESCQRCFASRVSKWAVVLHMDGVSQESYHTEGCCTRHLPITATCLLGDFYFAFVGLRHLD